MKMVTIAALAAASLSAASPAQAAQPPREGSVKQQTRFEKGVELALEDRQAAPLHAAPAREDEDKPRKKRKSTGDKVLTGAAVVLGIGALAVGGLLVAIFVG